MGLIAACVLLLCWSGLSNALSEPVITDNNPYFVCEDIPEDAIAFTIEANDPDGDALTYALRGVDASIFRIDNNGRVYRQGNLDRETDSVLDELLVAVSDGTNEATLPLIIIINDANDNRPNFEEASYDTAVSETTAVGTTLFKVTATDFDSGNAGSVSYAIDESVPNSGLNTFRIDALGNVILNEKLNFNEISTFYRIRITASDNGGKCFFDEVVYQSSSVYSFINVLDSPDLDPEFIGMPFVATVTEHTAIGHSVTRVTAFDPDRGINDKIIYSIQDSTSEGMFFAINQDGVISVTSDIDREEIGDTVTLTVKATETNQDVNGVHASAVAPVLINIQDINDNEPKFYQCENTECVPASTFSGQVLEHSLGAIFINMTVKDADKGARIGLSLDGDSKDIFSPSPLEAFSESPVELTVRKSEDLDFEKIQQVTLQVIAVDLENSALRSTADVTISILDTNDHSPEFEFDTYQVSVKEHSPDGTPVIKIIAHDPDTMDQGKLTYSLLPVSILEYFDVEPTTGQVYVKNGVNLDREIRSLYSATLQARDSEGKPGSAVLEITLTDINDKTPVPNRPIYQEFVYEDRNLENVKIEATDGDEPNTPNSQLVFTIEPGPYSMNFSIDPDTGVLTNAGPLDREGVDPALDGKIELTVKVSDKGVPPLSALVQVIINVQDVNDNAPVFENDFYNFTVKEGEKGAFVGSVFAKDADQTPEFNRISFGIVDGSFGSFMISSVEDAPGYTGNIKVDPDIELDYEAAHKIFRLKVEAADLPQEKAEVMVEVYVLDVNDERPEFRPIPPVEVEENTKETGPVGKFDAFDVDTNSSLVFELVSVTCKCGEDEEPCDWFVLEPNGEVKVNPSVLIDYELCQEAIVVAQVVDENTEKGEPNSASPGEMVINIKDVNDNTPEFIYSDSVYVVVSEGASKDTSVASVTAMDRDSGVNAQIEFEVTKVLFIDTTNPNNPDDRIVFVAKTTQQNNVYVGIIQTTEMLNVNLKGKYLVTVEARDTGGLTNSTELEIFLVDGSFKTTVKFGLPLSEIKAMEAQLIRDLAICTQASVQVVSLQEDTPESTRESEVTKMEAYFVYGNGTALESDFVLATLSLASNIDIRTKYQILFVGGVNPEEPQNNTLLFGLFGVIGGLLIVSVVLTTSLLCTRRNYRRKLKASDAMKSASNAMSENQRGGPVVPGTNLYTMEGANPVLNLNIDPAIALDMGEESDVDKVSIISLDNSDELMMTEKDTKPIMGKRKKDGDSKGDMPGTNEPLGAALAQRDNVIRSNNPLLGESNPIFDTTDL